MELDGANGLVGEGVVGQADGHLVGDDIEERAQQVGVLQVWVVAETDDAPFALQSEITFESVEPFKVIKSLELANSIQHFAQEAHLFVAQFLSENRETFPLISIYSFTVHLEGFDFGTKRRILQVFDVRLNTTTGDTFETIFFQHGIDLRGEVGHGVVVMAVREQTVQILVANESVLVYRHLFSRDCFRLQR